MSRLGDILAKAACGNKDAYNFLAELWYTIEVWDDLYDGDKTVGKDLLNRTMFALLVRIPANPFYRANFDRLQVLVRAAIRNWELSNETADLHVAYCLRASYHDIVGDVAAICGGEDHGRKVLKEIWDGAVRSEPFYDFVGGK